MLAQRCEVGLANGSFEVEVPLRVVPVVALQRGASAVMVRRMLAVRDALAEVNLGVAPVEIYEVNLLGELLSLDESRYADGRPRSAPATPPWRTSSSLVGSRARRSCLTRLDSGARSATGPGRR